MSVGKRRQQVSNVQGIKTAFSMVCVGIMRHVGIMRLWCQRYPVCEAYLKFNVWLIISMCLIIPYPYAYPLQLQAVVLPFRVEDQVKTWLIHSTERGLPCTCFFQWKLLHFHKGYIKVVEVCSLTEIPSEPQSKYVRQSVRCL